jgi:hypothetical protein
MEFGEYQLQIFVSLMVVLCAAFVALICDFLKGNNEQLRELAIELRVRREEDSRRSQTMLPQRMERSAEVDPEGQLMAPPPAEQNVRLVAPGKETSIQTTTTPAPIAEEKAAPNAEGPKRVAIKPVMNKTRTSSPAFANGTPKKDWNSLLSQSNASRKFGDIQKDLVDTVVAATVSQREIPSGFHKAEGSQQAPRKPEDRQWTGGFDRVEHRRGRLRAGAGYGAVRVFDSCRRIRVSIERRRISPDLPR